MSIQIEMQLILIIHFVDHVLPQLWCSALNQLKLHFAVEFTKVYLEFYRESLFSFISIFSCS